MGGWGDKHQCMRATSPKAEIYKSHFPLGRAEKIERLNSIQKRALKVTDCKVNQGLDEAQLMAIYAFQPLAKRRELHHLALISC